MNLYTNDAFDQERSLKRSPKLAQYIARYLIKQGSSQSLDTGFGLNEDLKYVKV